MRLPLRSAACVVVLGIGASVAPAAVTIAFSEKDATPNTATVTAGQSVTLAVFLNESATSDDVTGLDYRIMASASGDFRLLSRASTASFTPYVRDSSASVAPVTLSPTNGSTNLGGTTPDADPDLRGIALTEVADYTIQALAGTPAGTYTLSLAPVGSATLPTYSGGAPNFSTFEVAGETNFTVTVVGAPEPTALAATLLGGTLLGRRRRRA